jgi:4-amino-4-deoxy-L-arabinose transferase-like glycosyltransferase
MEKLLSLFKRRGSLVLIFLLALVLRFYNLANNPASLNRDEAGIGYNAYSLLKTGRDEWGEFLPLSFKSFGDYKAPIYIYFTLPSLALFGLNEFSVRFPSAFFGSLTVLVVYFLTKELFSDKDKNPKHLILNSKYLPIIASLLLAISPWHIHFSRYAFEANVALFFNALILYFLVQNKFQIDLKTLILIILSILTYSASFLIWPLFILLLAFLNWKNPRQLFRLLLVLLLLVPVIYFQMKIFSAKKKITIFSDPQIRLDYNKQRSLFYRKSPFLTTLFFNQYLHYGITFVKNYFSAFSPQFLFGKGGAHPWHKITWSGHFYQVFAVLILLSLVLLIRRKIRPHFLKQLIFWFFLSLLPSAITTDAPHATRLLNYFFSLNLLAAFGLGYLLTLKKGKILSFFLILFLFLPFLRYLYYYHFVFIKQPPEATRPGLKEAIKELNKVESQAEEVIFDYPSDCAYVYLLFYNQYPPLDFINSVKRYQPDTAGLAYVEKFDKYVFVSHPRLDNQGKRVYLLKGDNLSGVKVLAKINNPFTQEVYYTLGSNF